MKRTHHFSKNVKNAGIWFMLILTITIVFFLLSSGESLLLAFYAEGQGVIVNKMNRSGPGSGLFVRVDDGTEIRVTPSILWERMEGGDFLLKKRFSFTYQLNEEKHNAFFSITKTFLIIWSILFVLYVIGLLHKTAQEK